MASLPVAAPEISALIQLQSGSANSAALNSLRSLRNSSASPEQSNTPAADQQNSAERTKARDAANQFEALLIHNMLKGMRKTTMSENTSNQRALYDDMLDQQLAKTMVEAGGLGMAEQLVSQLQGNTPRQKTQALPSQDQARLRELSNTRSEPNPVKHSVASMAPGNAVKLRMASSLWQAETSAVQATKQQKFIEPLKAHAEQTAERLGTSSHAVLAIAALETGWGRHMITNQAGQNTHNYFGIKAQKSDDSFTSNTTQEFIDGESRTVVARFKSFKNLAHGMNGFADFILDNPRYSKALEHAQDPERFIKEIHKAGYATDPDYTTKALSILHQIDSQVPPL